MKFKFLHLNDKEDSYSEGSLIWHLHLDLSYEMKGAILTTEDLARKHNTDVTNYKEIDLKQLELDGVIQLLEGEHE